MAEPTITPRPADVAMLSGMSPRIRAEYRAKLLAPCPLDGKAGHIWTNDGGHARRWRCAGCTVGEIVAADPARRIAEALAALDAVDAAAN